MSSQTLSEGKTIQTYTIFDPKLPDTVRQPSVIYPEVQFHDDLETGHFVLIRGNTKLGRRVRVGTHSVIEGGEAGATIGDDTHLGGAVRTGAVWIGERVRVYAGTNFADMRKPPNGIIEPPVIEDDVVIGLMCLILPGVKIGKGAFVAAYSVVEHDVPAGYLHKRDGRMVPFDRSR